MAPTPATSERVVVLLEGPAAEAALETAAHVAARRAARLIALLVENVDLRTVAGLPFAREIGLVSGTARPFSAAALETRLSDRARYLRQRLERIAQCNAIEAELQIGRGRQAQTVLAHAAADDLLVLCRTHWAQRPGDPLEGVLAEALCTVMLVGPNRSRATAGPMVLLDASAGALRAVARAAVLAREEGQPLTLVVAPDVTAEARYQARLLLREYGVEGHFIELLRLDRPGVMQVVRRERTGSLLLSRDSLLLHGAAGYRLRVELDEVPLFIVP